MNSKKEFLKKVLLVAASFFAMFFGGGNFILPPSLGLKAADAWAVVALAFGFSAVLIPLLGILVQARLQSSVTAVSSKVHPLFAVVLGVLMYAVCLSFPIPRTSSVTYELAMQPYTDIISPLWFSIFYFGVVMYMCFQRGKVLSLLGKYLTPILLIIIVLIIGKAVFTTGGDIPPTALASPFGVGFLEGYQTFDGIAALIFGGVVITSLKIDNQLDFNSKRKLLIYGGAISGLLLLIIYTGFIYTGAWVKPMLAEGEFSRSQVLSLVSFHALGSLGQSLLGISVSIACFTTAVAVIVGAADFMQQTFRNSRLAYRLTVTFSCLLGVFVGQMGVEHIITVAYPTLVLIYPVIICLIFLNLVPEKYASPLIFKLVIASSIVFALPDVAIAFGLKATWWQIVPLAEYGLAWLLPSLVVWVVALVAKRVSK